MRIAMLGWEFPPFISGGLGVHCYELTKALARKGVEIDFFMPDAGQPVNAPWMNVVRVGCPEKKEDLQRSRAGPYGPEFRRLFSMKPGKDFFSMGFFDAVWAYNELAGRAVAEMNATRHYDLIHGHDWITMNAGIAAKKLTGRPLVFFVHSTEYDRTANLSPFQWIVGIEKAGVDAADLVMTNSRMMERQLWEKYGAGRQKTRVVYNAVDACRFQCDRALEKAGFGMAGKIVLFHGRLSIQKGPDFFLMAAKKVLEKEPDTTFVVSGKGDFLERLVKLAIDLGIEDRVVFTGYLPDEKLPLLYAASDVYVLPSVSEPFGITVLEAMAAGTPVIVSKTTGASEIVRHCLRVDFWDVDEMANKIIALLRYGELKEVLTDGAGTEVRGFSWGKAAEETIQVYCELVGK